MLQQCVIFSGAHDHATIAECDITLDIPEDLFPADSPASQAAELTPPPPVHQLPSSAGERPPADTPAEHPAGRSKIRPSTSFLNLLSDS
jgi:hypothetical protein